MPRACTLTTSGNRRGAALPVVLYNNPDRTSVQLPLDVIERLTDEFDSVIGLKQADPAQLVESTADSGVACRSGPEVSSTVDRPRPRRPGSISFSGNIIAPELVQVYQLWNTGEVERPANSSTSACPLSRPATGRRSRGDQAHDDAVGGRSVIRGCRYGVNPATKQRLDGALEDSGVSDLVTTTR